MTAPRHAVTFRAGDTWLGVEASAVREVMNAPGVMPVPRARPWVAGVMALRGALVPVVDVRARLELGGAGRGRAGTCVIVTAGGEDVALLADEPGDILELEPGRFEDVPPAADGAAREAFRSAYKLDAGLVLILDVERTCFGEPDAATAATGGTTTKGGA